MSIAGAVTRTVGLLACLVAALYIVEPVVCGSNRLAPRAPAPAERSPAPVPSAAAAASANRAVPSGTSGGWHYYPQDESKWVRRERVCPNPAPDVVLSRQEVGREQAVANWTRLLQLCCSAAADEDAAYRRVLYKPAGREHYALLAHLSRKLHEAGGGVVVELGVREGMSSVALGQHRRNAVFSFDLHDPAERFVKVLRSHGVSATQADDTHAFSGNVHFVRANIMAPAHAKWRAVVVAASLVLIDTAHVPEKHPFEYDVMRYLDAAGFAGVVVLDDIHNNAQMERFWSWVKQRHGAGALDATKLGHGTGTGIVNFCGEARLKS